jgi:hypothetical protein
MNKKWLLIPIITVIVILIIYGIFLLSNNPITRMKILNQVVPNTITEGNLPDEWGENFDPRLNPSTFMVNEKTGVENELSLTYVFPPIKEGQKIESMLVCEQGVEVKKYNEKKGEKVNIEQAISLMTLENGPIMITAYCGDLLCNTIVGKCDIYLSGKSK